MKYFWDFIGAIVLLSILSFMGWKVHSCIDEPPTTVHHCYISYSEGTSDEAKAAGKFYQLYGYRHHDNDLLMGKYETLGLAVDAAELINCPIQ